MIEKSRRINNKAQNIARIIRNLVQRIGFAAFIIFIAVLSTYQVIDMYKAYSIAETSVTSIPWLEWIGRILLISVALGNSALRKAIKDSVYADWHIYQPTDMEISGKNVFNTFLFKKGSFFPLVAEKNGVYCLLVMKKQKSGWVVDDAFRLDSSNAATAAMRKSTTGRSTSLRCAASREPLSTPASFARCRTAGRAFCRRARAKNERAPACSLETANACAQL